ncbi:aldehyde dehydrogenase family protein [Kineococcus rhizosphaerae]|uniref:Betaine-aldehyde dehydrogenase n=1 Tax=Kineococcus rhizosphaerae TaxID=559628 RepID=A0A2T0R1U7_9ACTN|nr:aldehyde dehydrogenase family protein [Kineococcus rhizosphaerae]PRY13485.1 betaine-aldehyde dehydrogenase [Kineococcus rhizosphaerae]
MSTSLPDALAGLSAPRESPLRVTTLDLPAPDASLAAVPAPTPALPDEVPDLVLADGPAAPGAATGELLDVLAPTTGERLLRVEDTSPDLVRDIASAVATTSTTDWSWLSAEDRARFLFAVADVLADHVRALAVTAALTTGRPLGAGFRQDAPAAHAAAFSAAGWADKLTAVGAGHRPSGGVVVVVTTWRTSTADALSAVVAALATGCGVVLRARPATAATARQLVRLVEEAGVPAGLVRSAPGADAAADAALWSHPDLVAVRADGSADDLRAVGVALAHRGTPLLQRLDAPHVDVVLAGANLEDVAAALVEASTGGAHLRPGGSRVLVVRPVADALVARVAPVVARLRTGHPLDRATAVGPVPTPHLARAAREVLDSTAGLPAGLPPGGWWAPPGLATVGRHSAWPPPGPVLGVRSIRSAADALPHLRDAGSVTVWGGELGTEVPAPPDARRDALDLVRACRG